MREALLIPVGTDGDVLPFAALGRGLQARGWSATLVANEHHANVAAMAGIGSVSLGTASEYTAFLEDERVWQPGGLRVAMRRLGVVTHMRTLLGLIAERASRAETLVVIASPHALGARMARDALGVPLATVVLQPAGLRAAYRGPTLGLVNHEARAPEGRARPEPSFEEELLGPVNALRAELGLLPVASLFGDWLFSPDRILGFFPEWFAGPRDRMPERLVMTGFAACDDLVVDSLPDEAEAFLAGGAPIVFTTGTGVKQCGDFLRDACQACRILGERGLLLCQFPEEIPDNLPAEIRAFSYLPLRQVLGRARALVHHGGMGTSAAALAAGVPQVIRPLTGDQPDNALRLVRMGVAACLPRREFNGASLAATLGKLLGSPDVAERCAEVAVKLALPAAWLQPAIATIEALVQG